MRIPNRYRARTPKGESVEGYFVMLNVPIFGDHGEVVAYREVPHIFSDSPGHRSDGSFWHEIRLDTLQEIKNIVQLDLFT